LFLLTLFLEPRCAERALILEIDAVKLWWLKLKDVIVPLSLIPSLLMCSVPLKSVKEHHEEEAANAQPKVISGIARNDKEWCGPGPTLFPIFF
jgi:hypothetical protein